MTAVGPYDTILDLFQAKFLTLAITSPMLPWSWPEKPFTPPTDGKYLEMTFLPNRPGARSLASDGFVEILGIAQITVHWPKNRGLLPSMEIASALLAALPRGTILSGTGVKVTIHQPPYPSSPLSDATGVQIPVTFPWQAFVAA